LICRVDFRNLPGDRFETNIGPDGIDRALRGITRALVVLLVVEGHERVLSCAIACFIAADPGYLSACNTLSFFTLRSDGAYVRSIAIVPVVSLVAALCLSGSTRLAGAQQAAPTSGASQLPLVPGARVRISSPTLVTPLMANFLETRGDTAVFIEAGAGRGIWTFTPDQITKLEQSIGYKGFSRREMLKYAAWGAPAGALVFWGLTGIIDPSDSTRKYDRTVTAVAGLAVGGVVGALVGSRRQTERWMTLPMPRRVSFNPFRKGGGVELSLGFGF